uniref:BHLH domain-containing protein n=1 Tax=Angiostrongylus cantonensis TaxID=6313 RepID=A0A0K0DA99_ANGCA
MHDLNEALEDLRSCLPYAQDASSRKMSKINTLLLASNWYESFNFAERMHFFQSIFNFV